MRRPIQGLSPCFCVVVIPSFCALVASWQASGVSISPLPTKHCLEPPLSMRAPPRSIADAVGISLPRLLLLAATHLSSLPSYPANDRVQTVTWSPWTSLRGPFVVVLSFFFLLFFALFRKGSAGRCGSCAFRVPSLFCRARITERLRLHVRPVAALCFV